VLLDKLILQDVEHIDLALFAVGSGGAADFP
jgi:hypothetical protein